ncbi:class I SAM-dependent methyltransferase [Comamonas sp. J-3]|uniref:class I SAM-dependent methyltransferase n=1 Tax=Comamonas trifloxystrobinivorans TaxID=3350256 RepID=UPI00372A1BA0
MRLVRQLQDKFFGLAPWDANLITDEWFRAHFGYAADVVNHWLGSVVDLKSARLLQFGCGDGITDLALVVRHGAHAIHGIDVRQEYAKLPRIAAEQLGMRRIPSALSFQTIQPSAPLAGQAPLYDGIMSWSTFEHVQRDQLLPILQDLCACLKPGGHFFLQIEPLFYSAYGSHLRRYDDVPWHHLQVSEEVLWEVIERYDGELSPDEVDFGFADFGPEGYKKFVFHEYQMLNRLTADELIDLTQQAGFAVVKQERRNYEPAPIPDELLQKYPRELLLNNEIFLLLQKPA